jgi:acetyl esterase/lipase
MAPMATPHDPPSILDRGAPPAAHTVSYGEDPAQVYDVRRPSGPSRDATVVVVHGGFWRQEFDRSHAGSQAQAFADDGFAVAVPEYRRVGMPGGGWPGTARDVAAAVAAVRADATLPDRVVLVGHSAGGHLALWVASQPEAHGLAGAVSLAGCVDLTLTARLGLGDRAAQNLMGGEPEGPLRAAYALADPALLLPAVPVVLLHGTDDRTVLPEVSRAYAQRMRHRPAGAPQVRLTMLPGADHHALIDPTHPAFATALATVRSLAA